MKKKLKSFLSKYRLTLIVAFLLIGTLFAHPFTVYSLDSDYLWHDQLFYNTFLGNRFGFSLFIEPQDDVEIIAYAEKGVFDTITQNIPWENEPHELRITTAELEQQRNKEGMSVIANYISWNIPYSSVYGEDRILSENSLSYTDYAGIIVKKNGKIVSASLYKMYGKNENFCGYVDELAVLEFPILNEVVTETYVKEQLRRIAVLDRVLTFDSALNRAFSPEWTAYVTAYNEKPPYSPTYNP